MEDIDVSEEARGLTNRIGPMFDGQDPEVIGVVLAVLTASWIARHSRQTDEDELHDSMVNSHAQMVHGLIADCRESFVPMLRH